MEEQKPKINSDDPKYKSWMKPHERPLMLQDRMDGFIFFNDVLDDFKKFDVESIDVTQRANVPLLRRSDTVNEANKAKSPILIMTDSGSCRPHEAIQGAIRPVEEYFVQFWQHIDVFNYFAHGHIALPPPTWINAAHRNGVQIIGTVIFEHSSDDPYDPQTSAMLELDSNGSNWFADKLARIAAKVGFDGWLLNIESKVHEPENQPNTWASGEGMKKFITQLEKGLHDHGVPRGGKVIWYDAVTTNNVNSHQCELNTANIDFSHAAKAAIVDYKPWTDGTVKLQAEYAEKSGLRRDKVYLGHIIHNKMSNGDFLQPLAKNGVGSGLFATSWCFYRFVGKDPMMNLLTFHSDADKYMWTGSPDLKKLEAAGLVAIDEEDGKEFQRPWNEFYHKNGVGDSIIKYAREYPAGSETFFFSNYGTAVDYLGALHYSAHINEQSVWPSEQISPLNGVSGYVRTRLKDGHGSCAILFKLDAAPNASATQITGTIHLHNVHLKREASLGLRVRFKHGDQLPGLKTWVCAWTDVKQPPFVEMELTGLADQPDGKPMLFGSGNEIITAIGLRFAAPTSLFSSSKLQAHVLTIFDMLVKPQNDHYQPAKITDVELENKVAEDGTWTRLRWNVSLDPTPSKQLPYSPLTGSFSHFDISFGGNYHGRSHTLAYVMDQETKGKLNFTKGSQVEVRIVGTHFDGTRTEVFKANKAWP